MNNPDRCINYSWLVVLVVIEIIVLNIVLPYPDINDFYELSRICLLMDSDVTYCVNNNWGFGHPLSCWILTKWTGDILISQRMINTGFTLVFLFSLLSLLSFMNIKMCSNKKAMLLSVFLFTSPWIIDLVLSMHIDIAPIALLFAGIVLNVKYRDKAAALFLAAILVGSSYWFRFHFLSFALLFPVFSILYRANGGKQWRSLIITISGIIISIALPHFLNHAVYGQFSISNEKFVLAQALGIADWSNEFAQKLEKMTVPEMFKDFNAALFIAKYGYNFLKSGIAAFLLIYGVFLFRYIKKNRFQKTAIFTTGSNEFVLLLIAAYAIIAVVPFTFIRGFTYRLEAAFVCLMFPLLLWAFTRYPIRKLRIIIAVLLVIFTYHHLVFWQQFITNRATLVHYSKVIPENIPVTVLQNNSEEIICCVDYYNPNNKYRLCNPMVFAGWGVRFKPFVENFGFLNLSDPYENSAYLNARYIILPSNPVYFEYPLEILSKSEIVYEDKNCYILYKNR